MLRLGRTFSRESLDALPLASLLPETAVAPVVEVEPPATASGRTSAEVAEAGAKERQIQEHPAVVVAVVLMVVAVVVLVILVLQVQPPVCL